VLPIALGTRSAVNSLLVIGAHADDVEIGGGGTVLRLLAEAPIKSVHWVVMSATGVREAEAEASATRFLEGVGDVALTIHHFQDGFLPYSGPAVKEAFEDLKLRCAPDLILTHRREDLHQDHRLVAELTWNTFRDHLILEYEIPKYEGDLGNPNMFVQLPEDVCATKIEWLLAGFPSQHHRRWFKADTFWSILRLRGLESNAPTGLAEGFHCRKMVL
jgi:LmbE family N-acetylglucosaminyl deacetylase